MVDYPDEDELPQYAILSHRWCPDEVSFRQFSDRHCSQKSCGEGLTKVQNCRAYALQRGYSYVWIDSCCIDRANSSELSEAINSMWRWYQNASECLVYLSDVAAIDHPGLLTDSDFLLLSKSSWFTRGWTLQELLAPREVTFLDARWSAFGTKWELTPYLSRITGIRERYVNGTAPASSASVAMRMSWISRRSTTKKEDMAYCLLGIFDVNMPLLYGEGAKSFMRLQLEILRKSSDESIFAWRDDLPGSGLLATTPKAFSDSGDIVQVEVNRYDRLPYCMTNQGLELRLPVESPQDEQPWYYDDPSAPSSRRPEPYFDINFARTSNDRMGMPIPHNGYDPVRFERRVSPLTASILFPLLLLML